MTLSSRTWLNILSSIDECRMYPHSGMRLLSYSRYSFPNKRRGRSPYLKGYDQTTTGRRKGGALLQGTFDEKESAAYFAEALRNWRMAGDDSKGAKSSTDKESRSCGTETGWTSRTARMSSPSEVKLNFGSSLTYADRLALKKNKQDPAAYIGYRYPAQKRAFEMDRRLGGSPSGSGVSRTSPRAQLSPRSNQKSPGLGSTSPIQKSPRSSQVGGAPNKGEMPQQQSQVVSIQRVPSNEDMYVALETEGNESPIIEDNSNDEACDKKEARQTLSQLGRLTIVELNFSDPEVDWNGGDNRRSKSATVMLSPSTTPSPQNGNNGSGLPSAKSTFTPRPPFHSAPESQKSRRKIVGNRTKQRNRQVDSETAAQHKASHHIPHKVWNTVPVYTGLNEFFLAGVDQENEENPREATKTNLLTENGEQISNFEQMSVLSHSSDHSVWRPDSSLAQNSDPISRQDSGFKSEEIMQSRRPIPEVKMTVESPEGSVVMDQNSLLPDPNLLGQSYFFGHDAADEHQDTKLLKSISALSSPRISLSDYDFLRAPPPIPKGDNFTKVHRASTVTIFGLSPQPPDVWNDECEIEITGMSPKRPASPFSLEQNDDDISVLDEFVRDVEMHGKMGREGYRHDRKKSLPFWEEEDLSIEDKDDGSGLSSPAETEMHYEGDESSEEDRINDKRDVLGLV